MDKPRPLLDPAEIAQLKQALTEADFTSDGVTARLGAPAAAAAGRGDHRAALRATADGDPLATLIRLFGCGQTEPVPAVAAALAPLPVSAAMTAGLVVADQGGLRAGLNLEPYRQWWVISDQPAAARPGRRLPVDHVLGIGGASGTLANATIRAPVGSALDLGTGCGVQALHLSAQARSVTATDLSPRALRFAATTAALNGLRWELLPGDLTAPVAGRRFDLVVSNPPFVVGPGMTSHTYRDSGRPGDAVSAELAAAAPRLLTAGGTMQYLANWLHVTGEDWRERVAGWFAGTGCDAWVIQREVSDPLAYVRLWLGDAGQHDPVAAAAWLDWFDAQRVEAVGFGLVTARRTAHDQPVVRVEDLRQPIDQPLGAAVAAWFDRQEWLRGQDPAGLLATAYRPVDGLRLRQEATVGDDGWEVDRQVLAQPAGVRWQEEADPLTVALVGAADGRLPLADQLAVLAAAYDVTETELAPAAAAVTARLVERGFLVPASGYPPVSA